MNELQFDRMLYAIAVGLYEKEQSTEKYPYSNHLHYGLNMLAAMAVQHEQTEMLQTLHETAFLTQYAVRPVKEWFAGWGDEVLHRLSAFALFETGALIEMEDRSFTITEECADLCGNAESDLMNALVQNHVYRMMRGLTPEQYTAVRKFIVEHPVSTEREIRRFKMEQKIPEIRDILVAAYETIPEESYRCPECGWTMQFHGKQALCCNQSCTAHHPDRSQMELLDTTGLYRLTHGVMRYMCLPGKLELAIQVKAEQYGCKTELWPELDAYDIRITLPGGRVWAVDAKTHRNPYTLADSIRNDSAFALAPAEKRLYVIPAERLSVYGDYCQICQDALQGKDVTCITDRALYGMLRKECSNETA